MSGREEGGLAELYKEGLAENWDITKNKLDDLYIRFFRVAERRIAEQTGKGIICLVTNSSWLGDPSAVVMRQRLLSEFGDVTIDHLNGDSRETGKKTPSGDPDPSVFSTKLNPSGITRGVAISMLVRADGHTGTPPAVRYRDFWGQDKREQLAAATAEPRGGPEYETLTPDQVNWYRLLRWHPRQGYEGWPAVTELCEADPMLGLNENRQFALIDGDRDALAARMRTYLDPDVPLAEVDPHLSRTFSGFDPARVRDRLLGRHGRLGNRPGTGGNARRRGDFVGSWPPARLSGRGQHHVEGRRHVRIARSGRPRRRPGDRLGWDPAGDGERRRDRIRPQIRAARPSGAVDHGEPGRGDRGRADAH